MNKNEFGFIYLEYADLPLIDIKNLANKISMKKADIEVLQDNGISSIPYCPDDPALRLKAELNKLAKVDTDIVRRTKLILLLHSVPGMILGNKSFLEKSIANTPFSKVPIIPISGQPCAIFHYGVQCAYTFLNQMSDDSAVIVVGIDVAAEANDRFYFGSSMGDSLVVGSMSLSDVRHRVLSSITDTHIIASNGENSSAELISRFRLSNPSFIRNAVEKCLTLGGLTLSDVDWIVPHTPYNKIINILSDVLRFPSNKIIGDYLYETGHLNSNDSFRHYARACKDGKISSNETALLINPGFGGTRGVTVLYNKGI